ncbi:MAG: diacylglycerol kinase family protein [Burkholderiales bacterium]
MTASLKPPLFIVFNVGSGHGDAAEARAAIDGACAESGRELHVMVVEDPHRISDLAREAVRRAQKANGIVVAAGGDGTINAVAQATLGSGCAFGVLPQGTFNYFSRTHGIPADTAPAMQMLLHETAQPVQVGLVNGRLFLVNASLGLYPKLLEDREAWKKKFGRSRLVAFGAGLMTLLRGHRNLRLRIEVHGETHDVITPTLFVGNNVLQMEQLGLPESQAIDSGELAAVTLRPVSRLSMLWLLLRGALGQLGEADQVVNFSFSRLTVRPSRAFGARRLKVATDGEITWLTLPLEFSVSPEPLQLIRPAVLAPERAPP